MAEKVMELTDAAGNKVEYRPGLEGVIAAPSKICSIDGQKGVLLYRGIPIAELAEHSTFEETAFFLLSGHLPKRDELADFENALKAQRQLPPEVLALLLSFPRTADPMDLLRTAVSALGLFDDAPADNSLAKNRQRAINLIAAFPAIVGAIQRHRKGEKPVPPRTDLNHAAHCLHQINGVVPDEYSARVLDVALILHADHGFNASTFTARVCISSLTDMYAALTAAVGSLKGPLHGGANAGVMQNLLAIGSLDRVEAWVMNKLQRKEKVMGFGHRVYKTYDPRARLLNQYSEKLAQITGNMKWYEMSRKMEEVMAREVSSRGIYPNVDFYSASVYYYLGLEPELFTPIFAVSRVAGWTAHVLEQLSDNRLYRPDAVYQGPREMPYVPIDQR
ncbi:MAG: citrate synthase [candidate division KSB1 bacterium]|nr:citrate synthase [candidate division KSB1 bacterium]MDZ7275284.1 citrate synthase [candidate division KSB1 bacterium]MDZ7287452.1 citrate synthase [candidate division KSB1 bacterium]MDZ7299566.1 citrate synthase [candidate division KSB1 bacterium]MDZ7308024.1 citrate synthase [candidate division KSB1 bacterium]